MKVKKDNGFVGIDMTIAIIAVIIFSSLIISLMHNNFLENLKAKREALATIYLTETLENIGIASYEEVTEDNKANFIPTDIPDENYSIDITITEDENEKITKKITATISYNIGKKEYNYLMERTKIKE